MRSGRRGRPPLTLLVPAILALLSGLVPAGPARAQPVPVLTLPGAGPVAGVVETRQRDGFDQRIRYEGGDGRNHAEIALRNETGDLLLAFPPRLAKPSQFGIESEIAVRFPGQVLRALPVPRQTIYGPVGMALGADCLYAWQWLERPSALQRSGRRPGLIDAAPAAGAPRKVLSLRIRLCRTAQASLGDLVAAVEKLRITLPGAAPSVERPAVTRPRPKAARRPAPVAKPAVEPAPNEPNVLNDRPAPPPKAPPPSPPPRPEIPAPPRSEPAPADQSGRRYIAPTQQAPAASAPEPAGPAAGGPQRYITDVPNPAEAGGRTPAPSPAPGRTTNESLSQDLPPEAYKPKGPPGGP
ncbi:cellulose biosynthesis protein BcsN [Methylobacterium organophilum]|uniref:Cellulose biosynthesis protein BcsN n=1 Tax=Methylobacterium organophilum TaxID=410 RepID=A0ABQ4TF99_METOR|nr:cellulose biosynthesis protein BcsN [Methylobacterium organophilum]GJE29404.1 hypothetical protein LKMONMHP_4285 [Methylobacterium organophilum]